MMTKEYNNKIIHWKKQNAFARTPSKELKMKREMLIRTYWRTFSKSVWEMKPLILEESVNFMILMIKNFFYGSLRKGLTPKSTTLKRAVSWKCLMRNQTSERFWEFCLENMPKLNASMLYWSRADWSKSKKSYTWITDLMWLIRFCHD